jgi:hypothetical protein
LTACTAVVKEADIQVGFARRGYELTLASQKEVEAMARD